jgi:anti-sigma regulatory factor (Ser/Thr protein kinase)
LSQNTTEIANECYQAILASTGNDTRATEIELVINEFLNNIIEHGLQEKKDATILLSFEIDKKITMKFIDNGKDWELPKPIEKNIAEPDKFRGMGMQIIYKLVSEIKKNRYDMINETIIEVDVSYE